MKKQWLIGAALVLAVFMAGGAAAEPARYVFFFIGDGLASAQIQAAEAYLTARNGGSANEATDLLNTDNRLRMTGLPVLGMQTTYDAHSLITDSASAGTALACGGKTAGGVIGMDAGKTVRYASIAALAAEQGQRVGIVTSVSLDHATPAAFYANVPDRDDLDAIAGQMAASGYDFFGGGDLAADKAAAVKERMRAEGYTILQDREAILALTTTPKGRVVAINPLLVDQSAMPYAIDRPAAGLSLAEMTEAAIASLRAPADTDRQEALPAKERGFFLMVEGGKIDWACHANDAATAIGEVLDFDAAIGAALAWYRANPAQTLIVVTGDHETGGMSVGNAATVHRAHYDRLLGQTTSFRAFSQNAWQAHKAAYAAACAEADPGRPVDNPEMTGLLRSAFGLDWPRLTDAQRKRLADAYALSLCGRTGKSAEDNSLLSGGTEPVAAVGIQIVNEQAGIGWTTHGHTGTPVPVFAIGAGAERFAGFYDNTDIAKRMAEAMGIKRHLPVVKPAAAH